MQEEKKCFCDHHDHDTEHCHSYEAEHEHVHANHETEEHDHFHEHGHERDHSHTHHHEHSHMHGHDHAHSHSHAHNHGDNKDPMAKATALLDYMANHNGQHAAELAEVGEMIRGLGNAEAADKIAESVKAFEQANAKLSQALELVKKL